MNNGTFFLWQKPDNIYLSSVGVVLLEKRAWYDVPEITTLATIRFVKMSYSHYNIGHDINALAAPFNIFL